MKKLITLLLVLLIIGSSTAIFAQKNGPEYADRAGRIRLGADLTMPTLFISLELTEFLGGPTIHYGLTDTIELKATLAPLIKTSYLLTQEFDFASYFAIGLVEAGARFYLSPYKQSWFIDTDIVAGFISSDYDIFYENEDFMFETLGPLFGVSIGHDFGKNLTIEAGAYLLSLELIAQTLGVDLNITSLEDLNFIPFPKVSVTYMF